MNHQDSSGGMRERSARKYLGHESQFKQHYERSGLLSPRVTT
jgi:hypothetical protein